MLLGWISGSLSTFFPSGHSTMTLTILDMKAAGRIGLNVFCLSFTLFPKTLEPHTYDIGSRLDVCEMARNHGMIWRYVVKWSQNHILTCQWHARYLRISRNFQSSVASQTETTGKSGIIHNYIKHRVGKEWFVESDLLNTFFYWLPAFLALIQKPLAVRDSITPYPNRCICNFDFQL